MLALAPLSGAERESDVSVSQHHYDHTQVQQQINHQNTPKKSVDVLAHLMRSICFIFQSTRLNNRS